MENKDKNSESSHEAEIDFQVRFPVNTSEPLAQDQEWCTVIIKNQEHRIRFHDYDEIYRIPGLYEHIFYEMLNCRSPQLLSKLLSNEMDRMDMSMKNLCVLDLGAGNGIMGEMLHQEGVRQLTGVDILPEAKAAVERDRPGIYRDYLVADLTDLPVEIQQVLEKRQFNCLTLVAALGFGDIPPEAFMTAFNLIEEGGWIVFNIKDEFLEGKADSGFASMIRRMIRKELLEVTIQARYIHRLSIHGESLVYSALVGRKRGDLDPSYLGN